MNPLVERIKLRQPSAGNRLRLSGGAGEPLLLSHFFAGPENRFAAFVCSSQDSLVGRGNPLVLFGPSGSGKSALGRTILAQQVELLGEGRTIQMPAVDFARRFAEAIDGDSIEHFRKPFETAEFLFIDDLHFLADKERAQEELALRLEKRTLHGLITIITARKLPTEIRGMHPLLASRTLPGLALPIACPGPEARLEIVSALAKKQSLAISPGMLEELAESLPAGISALGLGGVVSQLRLLQEQEGSEVFDRLPLESLLQHASLGHEVTIGEIVQLVAKRLKQKSADLKGPSRRQQVVHARSIAMYLCRRYTHESLQRIGDYFGGRDHTTVMHACRKTVARMGKEPSFQRTIDELAEGIMAATSPRAN